MQINVHTIDFYPLRMFPFCSQEWFETHCCLHRSGLPFVASRLQGLPSDFQKMKVLNMENFPQKTQLTRRIFNMLLDHP